MTSKNTPVRDLPAKQIDSTKSADVKGGAKAGAKLNPRKRL